MKKIEPKQSALSCLIQLPAPCAMSVGLSRKGVTWQPAGATPLCYPDGR